MLGTKEASVVKQGTAHAALTMVGLIHVSVSVDLVRYSVLWESNFLSAVPRTLVKTSSCYAAVFLRDKKLWK